MKSLMQEEGRESHLQNTFIESHHEGFLRTIPKKSIFLFLISLCVFVYASILTIAPYGLQADFLLSHELSIFQFRQIWSDYFLGYVSSLILCGVLVDLLGETWTLVLGMALALLGHIVFTESFHFQGLLQGRTIIGFDYGLISVAILKQLSDTFTRRHFAFGLAIIAIFCVAVTILSQNFLDMIVYGMSWKTYLNGLTYIGIPIFLLTLIPLFLSGNNFPEKKIAMGDMVNVIKQPAFWFGSIAVYIAWQYIFFLMSHVSVPYLSQHLQFSTTEVTTIVSVAMGFFALSALVLGYYSEAITRKRVFILTGFLLMVAALVIFIDDRAKHVVGVSIAMSLGAVGASVIVLIYARLREYCSSACVGFAFGLVLLVYTLIQLMAASYLFLFLSKIEMAATHYFSGKHAPQYGDLLGLLAFILLAGACLSLGLHSRKQAFPATSGKTLLEEMKECWQGVGSLGRAFWGVYVFGNIYVTLALFVLILMAAPSFLQSQLSALWGSLLLIPYQGFSFISLWRCASNTPHRLATYGVRIIVILGALQILLQLGLAGYYWLHG